MNVAAGYLPGNPTTGGAPSGYRGFSERTRWSRCNLPVEGHGGFESYQRSSSPDVLGKALVYLLCFFFKQAGVDSNSGGTQFGEAFAAHFGIGIFHCADDAANSGGDDGVSARRGASLMRTRLEIDVESATSGAFPGLFKSYDFGVLYPFVCVRAFAGFLAG